MEILQQRERHAAQRFRPVIVGKSAIDAHTQHLGVTGLELALESFESRDLLASSRRPIQGIEHQHDIFLALELIQGELGASEMADEFEIRRLFADFNHDVFSSFCRIYRREPATKSIYPIEMAFQQYRNSRISLTRVQTAHAATAKSGCATARLTPWSSAAGSESRGDRCAPTPPTA